MPLPVETRVVKQPINKLLHATVLQAFSFLLALEARDLLAKVIAAFLPGNTSEKLVFSLFIVLVVALVTLLIITYWST